MGSRPSRNHNNDTIKKNEQLAAQNVDLKYKISVFKKEREEYLCRDKKSLKTENETLRTENDKLTAKVRTLKKRIEERAFSEMADGRSIGSENENEADQLGPHRSRTQKPKKSKYHYNDMHPMSDIDAYGQGLPPQQHENLTFTRSRKNSRKKDNGVTSGATSPQSELQTVSGPVPRVTEEQTGGKLDYPDKQTNGIGSGTEVKTDHTKLIARTSEENSISVDSGIGTEARVKCPSKIQTEKKLEEPDECDQKMYINLK